jgi:hypothetical protein
VRRATEDDVAFAGEVAAAARRRGEILDLLRAGECPGPPDGVPDSARLPLGQEVWREREEHWVLGSGSYVLISADYVWKVDLHHMDGDLWDANNYARVVARRVPRDESLVEEILHIEDVYHRFKTWR